MVTRRDFARDAIHPSIRGSYSAVIPFYPLNETTYHKFEEVIDGFIGVVCLASRVISPRSLTADAIYPPMKAISHSDWMYCHRIQKYVAPSRGFFRNLDIVPGVD